MYTIGIDFGTRSGRVMLVDASTGEEVATVIEPYTNGVIDKHLPDSDTLLPPDWALQDPHDYLKVLASGVPAVLHSANVSPKDVAGLAIAFTSSTVLPTTVDGTPLCFLDQWRGNPHAWVKLWKHHAAQLQADQMTTVAQQRGEAWLDRYGGKISSEWFFSKVLQILQEAPQVYAAAERFIEAADWIIWQLTGVETRSACLAGYKACFQDGQFPSQQFFAALAPEFGNLFEKCLGQNYMPIGTRVGTLTEHTASWLGLSPATSVAVANGDGFATVPAVKVTRPGKMVVIMGTSACHMLLTEKAASFTGICGVVRDGIVPGYFGNEAGQSAVGDMFAWFIENAVAPEYHSAAHAAGLTLHQYLEREAARQKPGESGLLALDWWNGNRSLLVDASVTGMLIGATLATRASEVYRALIEATAFGTRLIIEAFEATGIEVDELILTGGIPSKNRLLVQIYSDVTGRQIRLGGSPQASALGAAMYAAVAAGLYPDITAAAEVMGKLDREVFYPSPTNQKIYDKLYAEYKCLYDYFGHDENTDGNNVMKRLKEIRNRQRGASNQVERSAEIAS